MSYRPWVFLQKNAYSPNSRVLALAEMTGSLGLKAL